MTTRSPICTVVGHVDHGKSSILDAIRDTNILQTEAGAITQAIGASIVSMETIKKKCGTMLDTLNMNFSIPGLLFIDTPGHAAFTNLRKRGGNLADIAILVVDLREGFMPQTIEAVEILKSYKTPFLIAANKVDLINGWQRKNDCILPNIAAQSEQTMTATETKLYEIVGKMSELGFESERFDRVSDYTKQIAIVPVSAKTGEGLPELLMVLAGLAQKFLEQTLNIDVDSPAKGTVLEVKEEKGLGTTMDLILYDGTLNVGDRIVIGDLDGPIVTKVKALFQPASMKDMRDKKSKFTSVKSVSAAIGVKLTCPDIDKVLAGMPVLGVKDEEHIEEIKEKAMSEIEEVMIDTDDNGIIIKADTLGSLEAMIHLFREKEIPIRRGNIGNISKKDIYEAEASRAHDEFTGVIMGFNVKADADVRDLAEKDKIEIMTSDIIYKLLDDFEEWKQKKVAAQKLSVLDGVARPAKLVLMRNHTFRQSNPAVVGADILKGTARTGMRLMNIGGEMVTSIKSMQKDKDSANEAAAGTQLAISLPNVTMGRQLQEEDVLYSDIPEPDFRTLKKYKQYLKGDEIDVLKEIAEIKRKKNPVWGV